MRICLLTPDPVWLAGDPGLPEREHSPAGDLSFDPTLETQTAVRVRAPEAAHWGRGNYAMRISFSTARLYASGEQAAAAAALYDVRHPHAGTLRLCRVTPGAEAIADFPGALVLPPRRQVIGRSVLLAYEALAGLPVPPPGGEWEDMPAVWEDMGMPWESI